MDENNKKEINNIIEKKEYTDNNVEPVTDLVQPVTKSAEPVTESAEPVSEIVEPVTELVEPVTEIVEPVTEIVEPVTKSAEPVTKPAEPVTELTEPVTELVQPVTKLAEPLTKSAEPVTNFVQPVTNLVEPPTLFDHFKYNYPSLFWILLSIYCISNNFLFGLFSFIIVIFLAYLQHKDSHSTVNIFSILHHYHHNHNNFFSHFSQIILELGSITFPFLINYFLDKTILDPWIIIFFILFYSSIHNINYSLLHINSVHKLHHQLPSTNIGPDICDVIFGTKHPNDQHIENTNHYIPNIIIILFLIITLQKYWNINIYQPIMKQIFIYLLSFFFLFIISSSIYLWITIKPTFCNQTQSFCYPS